MKKDKSPDPCCATDDTALLSDTAAFINATKQRFFSPLLLNFLCLKRVIEQADDNQEERDFHNEEDITLIAASTQAHRADNPCLAGNDMSQHTNTALFRFLRLATDGRITQLVACEKDGKTIRKPFVFDIILLLGTLRLKPRDNGLFTDTFYQLTKALEKHMNNMSCLFHITECQKNDHRECRITPPSATALDNGAALDIMMRRCIGMVANLQRKALHIALRRDRLKDEMDKRIGKGPTSSVAPDTMTRGGTERRATDDIFEARDVANALKDAYQREEELTEQLSRIRAQLEHINAMIDTTRQAIVKLSTFLLESYRDTFLSTQKTQRILTQIPGIPAVLQDTFTIETVCTDLLQTVEMIRQFSINADKLIESRYHHAVNDAIWPSDNNLASPTALVYPPLASPYRSDNAFSQKYEAINRLHHDAVAATQGQAADEQKQDHDNDRQRYIRHLNDAYRGFLHTIQQARQHVNQQAHHLAAQDIRAIAFAFFNILEKRLSARSHQRNPVPLSVKAETLTRRSAQPSAAINLDEVASDEINLYETEQLIDTELNDNLATLPYLKKRHLTLRSIGEMASHLRNEQNIFQLDYLINAISRQMENLYALKNSNNADQNPADWPDDEQEKNQADPAIDECIVSHLTRINNANFDLDVRTWKNVENWPYCQVDSLRLTHLAANLSNLTNQAELTSITELIALYAYLLSYKLEQILFVPRDEKVTNPPPRVVSNGPFHSGDNDASPDVPDRDPSLPNQDQDQDQDQDAPDNLASRQAIKRQNPTRHSDDSAPWHKRQRLDDDDFYLDSDEDIPMIVDGTVDEHSALSSPPATLSKPQPNLPLASSLRKTKPRQLKRKSYAKLYRSKQKDTLRMFYKNEAITNLGDILQGVRFEIRQKARNAASYEQTLRRLHAHLNKLKNKKKRN